MSTSQETNRTPSLGEGQLNTQQGSSVKVPVSAAPATYLRLDTGEVIGVPAADAAYINAEFDRWNRLMYRQLLANEMLAVADARCHAIATAKASNPLAVSATVEKDAQEVQGWAVKWREEATEAVRTELKRLDTLGGTGKQLIELVPLMEKEGDKPWQSKKDEDNGQWKRDGTDLSKSWNIKAAAGIREKFEQKERFIGVGPLRVMGSDKLKKQWPQYKDKKATKWAEVYKKDEATGKRTIDKKKMRTYLGEQVTEMKRKSTDFFKLEVSNTGTLGPEFLAEWNKKAVTNKEGKLTLNGTHLADVDFSAEAAAMRYYSGGSLSAEIAPLKGNLNFKAEGSAEVAFAEGRMEGKLYLPSKAGLMLYFLDLEQIKSLASGGTADTGKYDMGAIRLAIGAELKGLVGVSIAGEVSIGVAMQDVETTDVDGKKKRGKVPVIKGSRKKIKRNKAVDVNGAGAEWKNTAKLAAEVNFFAGVKGGLEIKGAVEWRNPHNAKKDFEILASIAPQVQGMAGLAGQLKLAVEYVDGIFRVTAHAGLCFGLGAEGTVSLAVGAKQLGTFLYWLYYNLLHIGFKNAKFIAESAFEAFQQLTYLLICQGGNAMKSFGVALDDLRAAVISLEAEYQKAESCLKLAGNILANPESVRLSPPETKGMLIYQLTRHGKANWSKDGFGLLDSFLSTQRRAVLAVLRNTTIKSDLDNVIQHIHPKGQKVNFNTQMKMLGDFFALEGPGGLNVPGTKTSYEKDWEKIQRERGAHFSANKDLLAINGDFQAWYDLTRTSLRTEHIRGMPAVENSCLAYTLQGSRDHVLFSSAHYGFYGPKT